MGNASSTRPQRNLHSPRSLESFSSRGRLSHGALSAFDSQSLDMERKELEKSLHREHRWLKRALSEEMRHVSEMQKQQECGEQLVAERREREQQAERRRHNCSKRHWEHNSRKKQEQEKLQREESRVQRDAFEQNRQQLLNHEIHEEQRTTQIQQRQQHVAEKRLEMLANLEARRESQRQHNEDARKLKEECEQTREGHVASRQAEEQQRVRQIRKTLASKREGAKTSAKDMEEDRRSKVAEKVATKSDKADTLASERDKLREMRRTAQMEARRLLQQAKSEVVRQSVNSKFSRNWLEDRLNQLEQQSGALSPNTNSCVSVDQIAQELHEDSFSEDCAAGVNGSAT